MKEISDYHNKQYLALHLKPASSENLYSHQVTKQVKTWNVSIQHRWLEQFPRLSYSAVLSGGIYRQFIFFPEQPVRGSNLRVGRHFSSVEPASAVVWIRRSPPICG